MPKSCITITYRHHSGVVGELEIRYVDYIYTRPHISHTGTFDRYTPLAVNLVLH